MAKRALSVVRVEEIQRLLKLGRKVREIARALQTSRKTVRKIRDGGYRPQGPTVDRPWLEQVHWESVLEDFHLGNALKDIWQDRLSETTSYSNFWKAFYQKYPELKLATVTLREMEPGERVEIDWAGGIIPWADPKTGQVFEARVFIGVLGFSQLFFATAKEDMKSRNFLECHQEMFESFGGVPRIIVPDCLKTGVSKCHLYDPDLNAAYSDLGAHYGVAIVPARPKHPKDKPFVEGAVRIILRTFRWIYRKHTFQSVFEIQSALKKTYELLNKRPHTRFRVSRFERFEKVERVTLKHLPTESYEVVEWKEAKVHPDCHIGVEGAYYSVPHQHRGRRVRVKLTKNRIEIFLHLERLCTHGRDRQRLGRRVTEISHLPENSRAYREATPQNLLSQARFISQELYELLQELFELDAIGHLRRAQGFLREARKFSQLVGAEVAKTHFKSAIEQMKHFSKIRVPYFKEILMSLQKQTQKPEDREVERNLINPWLRYPEKENKNVPSTSQKPLPRNEAPGLPLIPRSNANGGSA